MVLLDGILAAAAWTLFLSGLAWPVTLLLQRRTGDGVSEIPLHSYSVGLGLAVFSTLLLGLALAGWLDQVLLGTLAGIGIGAGLLRTVRFVRRYARSKWAVPVQWRVVLPLGGLTLLALPWLVLPPSAWDALVYHLEIPRYYLQAGRMIPWERNLFGYFPQGIDLLFLFSLRLAPPFFTQIIHFTFLPLTGLLLVETLQAAGRDRGNALLGLTLLGCLFTVPTLFTNALIPYIDTGVVFYTGLVFSGIWLAFSGKPRALVPAALAAGFLPAIKYTGVLILAVILVMAALAWLWDRRTLPGALVRRAALALSAGFGVFFGGYLLRNLLWTGNPVFPFLTTLVGSRNPFYGPDEQVVLQGFLESFGQWLQPRLLWPLHYLLAAVNPIPDDHLRFDGVIGPVLLLPWLVVLLRRRRPEAGDFLLLGSLAVYGVIWGVGLRQARFLLPILPAVFLYLGDRLPDCLAGRRKWVVKGVLGVTLLFNLAVLVPWLGKVPVGGYLSGRLDRDSYLALTVPAFPAQRVANGLPASTRLWVLFTSNRNFYLDRPYFADYLVEDRTFHQLLLAAATPAQLSRAVRGLGVTHLLINEQLLGRELYIDDPPRQELAIRFFRERCRPLFTANNFWLFELKPEP